MNLGGFPDHRIGGAWLAMLFLIPPLVLAALEPTSIVSVLLTVGWFGVASGLAVVALLDWTRSARSPEAWPRRVGRILVAALGLAGVVAGLLVFQGAVRVVRSPGQWKAAACLALLGVGCVFIGGQLTWLPFTRSRSPRRQAGPFK